MFSVSGLYIGSETRARTYDGKQRVDYVISVADGIRAHLIYLEGPEELKRLDGCAMGDSVSVSCEPMVGRNGNLLFLHGKVI